jgi:hypothetical protein
MALHWHAKLMRIPLFDDLDQVWSVWKEERYQRRVDSGNRVLVV